MSHTEILKILRAFKENCAEQYGIISLGLFGSAARDESQDDSDVDIVIKLKKQDMFNMIGIKQDLEEALHANLTRNHKCRNMDELMCEVRCYLAKRNRVVAARRRGKVA